ncbi:MAG TPA: hypothetical protein VMY34_02890 [Acidimicrobiales bacterium]|nr:hypothetical protein [Acidimicrobiales bacterium]
MDSATHGPVRGRDLRYLLTLVLQQSDRPLSVAELVTILEQRGHAIDGRPSKAVSDALRWEIGRGRVIRVGRSSYLRGRVPRSTLSFIRSHLGDRHAA